MSEGWEPSRIPTPGAQACAVRQLELFMKFHAMTIMAPTAYTYTDQLTTTSARGSFFWVLTPLVYGDVARPGRDAHCCPFVSQSSYSAR